MSEIIQMDTRERILHRAKELFFAFGIRNVTMDALATDLGVSKRTIYEIFQDKDDLVLESIRLMIEEDNKELLQIIEDSEHVIEALFNIIRQQRTRRAGYAMAFLADVKKYFPVVQATFYVCKKDLKKFSASYILLERGIKEGIFRKDLMIEMVDNYLHEMVTIIHQSERIRSLKVNELDIINNIFIPYFRGICTPKGLALMDQFFKGINE